MNVLEIDKISEKCTGCLSCISVCDRHALSVGLNDEGFYFPKLDISLCVNCGKCANHCFKIKDLERSKNKSVYSVQAKDDEILLKGTSGAFFQVIAKNLFEKGYYVFGTVFDKDMILKHVCAKTTDDIEKMGGSKYVQSNPVEAYLYVEKLLTDSKKVLFSGTPCQIAGLKSYLNPDLLEGLITIDIPCYGIPSVKFFNDTVKYYEEKYKAKMIDFKFRDKRKNGFSHTTVMSFKRGKRVFDVTVDKFQKLPYHYAFGQRDFFQKKCYNCEYTCPERVSDITMASFWGIENLTDKYQVSKGVSMVLINTLKGQNLFNQYKSQFYFQDQKLKDAYKLNSALVKNLKYPLNRDEIGKCYVKKGYKKLVFKYYKYDLLSIIKRRIKRLFNITNHK